MSGDIEPVYAEIGERVARLRDERGLTQEQLAERVGLSANHIAKVERAFKRSTIATLAKIAENLGVTLAALVSEDTTPGKTVPGLAATLERLPADDQRAILRLAEHLANVRRAAGTAGRGKGTKTRKG